MKVAFINEIADLCETVDADVLQVAKGMGLDSRIGAKFLQAGPGFGGSCFPKDTLALVHTAAGAGAPVTLVEAVIRANDVRKHAMAGKVVRALGADLRGKIIGVLGLTFKPNTDDMRAAPSLDIIPALQSRGARIQAFDPSACDVQQLLRSVERKQSAYAAAEDADCLLILTAWDQFRALDLPRIRRSMRTPLIVDFHNLYLPADTEAAGLRHIGVGRPRRRPIPARSEGRTVEILSES
jgi:UDPglucose 6-dehydrogenase